MKVDKNLLELEVWELVIYTLGLGVLSYLAFILANYCPSSGLFVVCQWRGI